MVFILNPKLFETQNLKIENSLPGNPVAIWCNFLQLFVIFCQSFATFLSVFLPINSAENLIFNIKNAESGTFHFFFTAGMLTMQTGLCGWAQG